MIEKWNHRSANTYQELNSNISRFDNILLKSFVPKPEDIDFETGYITRYFIAKSWAPDTIVEVSVDTYDSDFSKLNLGAYSRANMNWYISGNLKDYVLNGGKKMGVLTKNRRAINMIKGILPAIIILKQNLLQFYKSENLYTNGGEYTLTQGGIGPSYVGLYHIAAGIGPMVGPHHTGTPHATLYPMDGSNPAIIGNSLGGTL